MGGDLMVFGSPVQRKILAGVNREQATDYAVDCFKRALNGIVDAGVRYEEHYAFTDSMVLRSASGTMRFVNAYHPMGKLRAKGLLPEQVVLSAR